MNSTTRLVIAVLFCGLTVTAQQRNPQQSKAHLSTLNFSSQANVAAKITAIRARLFYDAKGSFSDDLLTQKDLALWNTIIGEGSSGGASTSTFVTVEISGQNLPVGTTKVEITATGNKGRLIQKKVISVDIYDERTKFFAPLWLYDTGCEPINISARLMVKGMPGPVVTRKIPFACGE